MTIRAGNMWLNTNVEAKERCSSPASPEKPTLVLTLILLPRAQPSGATRR